MVIKPQQNWFVYKAPRFIVDTETISRIPLSKPKKGPPVRHGGAVYHADLSTTCTVLCYKDLITGENYAWYNDTIYTLPEGVDQGQNDFILKRLCSAIEDGESFVAHNILFDAQVLGLSVDATMRGHCTKALANFRNISGSLADASNHFKLGGKHSIGKVLTDNVCKYYDTVDGAKKAAANVEKAAPNAKFVIEESAFGSYVGGADMRDLMAKYCMQDMELCAQLWEKLQFRETDNDSPAARKHSFLCDRVVRLMNLQGCTIDRELVEILEKEHAKYAEKSTTTVVEATGYRPAQSQRLKDFVGPMLESYGIENEGTKAEKLIEYLSEIPHSAKKDRKLIDILLTCRDTSGLKAQNMLMTNEDNKIYDYLVARGTITGRYKSLGNQVQNFPKPNSNVSRGDMTDLLKEVKRTGVIPADMRVKNFLRPCLIPPKGYKFYDFDLSQIEPRVAMYKLGLLDMLDKFANPDKDGYIDFAKNVWLDKELTKKSPERDIAKKAFMALLYGRGIPGLMSQLAGSGIYIEKTLATKLYKVFHDIYPFVKKAWYALENEAKKNVIYNQFSNKLLSGRYLVYPNLEYVGGGLKYRNINHQSSIYHSMFYSHDIQGETRDIMTMTTSYLVVDHGQTPCLDCHDQALLVVPEDVKIEVIDKIVRDSADKVVNEFYPGLPLDFDSELCDYFYK